MTYHAFNFLRKEAFMERNEGVLILFSSSVIMPTQSMIFALNTVF